MADAAEGDVDLNVVRPGLATGDPHRFQRFVASTGAIGIYKHQNNSSWLPGKGGSAQATCIARQRLLRRSGKMISQHSC